jgi:hypothetical protein
VAVFPAGKLTVVNSTVSQNTASSGSPMPTGGGIAASGPVTLINTIVAGNKSSFLGPDLVANVTSGGAR